MPSSSPGTGTPAASSPTAFTQLLPGAPTPSLQSFATFVFRFKRYIAYISGCQLNILSSPTKLVQAVRFKHALVAIAVDNASGKLVVTDSGNVWILEPISEGWTKLWWEKSLRLERGAAEDVAQCLSWGSEGEVLVGGRMSLALFSTLSTSRTRSHSEPMNGEDTIESRTALWEKRTASPIFQAAFSPSSSIIATRACYDRLVKIWRRLSFEEGLFDYTYLPHLGTVTHLQWRPLEANAEERRGSGISGRHEDEPEVLYTIANDGLLRVWRAGAVHDLNILILHTTIDLVGAIPQSPTLTANASQLSVPPRYALIIPSDHFRAALNAAIGLPQEGKVSHSKELLKEMVSQELDVVVAFDGQGRMSAWGLQIVGHKRRPATPTAPQWFHIAHSEGLQLRFPPNTPAICGSWFEDDRFHILSHTLTQRGELAWWSGDVETFFSSSAGGYKRIMPTAIWNGHAGDVLNLHPHSKGMVSWSADAVTLWDSGDVDDALKSRAMFRAGSEIFAVATIMSQNLVLTVTTNEITAWDQRGSKIGHESCNVRCAGRIHVNMSEQGSLSGVFVSDDASTIMAWSLQLSEAAPSSQQAAASITVRALNLGKELAGSTFAMPVSMPFDPSQSCIVTASKTGRLACIALSSESTDSAIAVFETGLSDPVFFAATEEFAALVSHDGLEITVVDLTDGYLECQQKMSSRVTHLEAFSPKSKHNFLAVGHDVTVDLLAQGRYEHRSAGLPIWVMVKRISIAGTGLRISALAWMAKGSLVLAAGNSLLITGANVDPDHLDAETRQANDLESDIHLAKLAVQLKSPLPAWHPSLLSHLVHHGHFGLVSTIIAKLSTLLKFWGIGEELHPTLDEPLEAIIQQPEDLNSWLSDDAVHDLVEQLNEKNLPALSDAEQRRLLHVVEAIAYLRLHVTALDKHAQRYLFNWKLQLLYSQDKLATKGLPLVNPTDPLPQFVPEIPWREVAFAQHSSTQQALLDIILLHHDNRLTWPIARRLGLTSWLSDRGALEQVFEQMAQSAYRSESPPDPVNASLYFLALKKKPTLLALWRIATWHKEQRTTTNFLKRDFAQADAKTAARKNAYALMGKRRFHYSAAFFLLADDPSSAVSVLAGQCEDAHFAIAVARLYCGDGSDVLRRLLEDRIVPQATLEGNRWLLSWCHSILLEKSAAASILIEPLAVTAPKTWQQDDPSTLLLYVALRGSNPSPHEYDAVLRAARILRRMGLWLLALDLVSRWEFLAATSTHIVGFADPVTQAITNGARKLGISQQGHEEATSSDAPSLLDDFTSESTPSIHEPPSLLDDFTKPEPAKPGVQGEKATREAKAAEMLKKLKAKKGAASPSTKSESERKKPQPTQFEEPDANSLLDSFGL